MAVGFLWVKKILFLHSFFSKQSSKIVGSLPLLYLPLNVCQAMQEACRYLCGEHDFRNFCKVVTMIWISWLLPLAITGFFFFFFSPSNCEIINGDNNIAKPLATKILCFCCTWIRRSNWVRYLYIFYCFFQLQANVSAGIINHVRTILSAEIRSLKVSGVCTRYNVETIGNIVL